jgi:hypothetical protein
MTLAIEPMVNLGGFKTKTLSDGWTVVSADGSPSAHFEHTVLTTDRGPEILTVPRPKSPLNFQQRISTFVYSLRFSHTLSKLSSLLT